MEQENRFIKILEGPMVPLSKVRKMFVIRGAYDKYVLRGEFDNGDGFVIDTFKTKKEAEAYMLGLFQ